MQSQLLSLGDRTCSNCTGGPKKFQSFNHSPSVTLRWLQHDPNEWKRESSHFLLDDQPNSTGPQNSILSSKMTHLEITSFLDNHLPELILLIFFHEHAVIHSNEPLCIGGLLSRVGETQRQSVLTSESLQSRREP